MKKYSKYNLYLIDMVIFFFGIILLLVTQFFLNTIAATLFEAIGTSLIAASLVDVLIRRFHSEQDRDGLKLVTANRIELRESYIQKKYSAQEVDILSISLKEALDELANDPKHKMLDRVLFKSARMRLLFVSPLASYMQQRSIEAGITLSEAQATQDEYVKTCVLIFHRFQSLYKKARENKTLQTTETGSLEIRLIDICPHFTTYRTDKEILWGLYLLERARHSAVISVTEEQTELYSQLTKHFERIWDLAGTKNILLKYHGPDIPTLNNDLISQILPSGWQSILQDKSDNT